MLGAHSSTLANHEGSGNEHAFANAAFEERWERLDRPVAEFGVDRTFWWGPGPYTEGMTEEYAQSPGNERLVQYFDKTRMEINNPNANPDELWYVTNGLLVVEMIEGKIQVGDAEFRDAEPANVPVAGDPDNPLGPTYATLAQRLDDAPHDQNALIAERLERDGNVTQDESLADYGIGIGTYVLETDHTVAEPFWEIMNASGPVWVDGQLVTDQLFRNEFYAIGYPIMEPYWSTAVVAGVEQDVLLQCFERRCLTYTPGNEAGFQVEAGNVGQHYYRWRYGDGGQEPDTETVNIFFVALGDNGANGQLIGCGDSLVPVDVQIEATNDTATRVERALMALFEIEDEFYGQSGYYNSLYQSDLSVNSVAMNVREAIVEISGNVQIGGTCDEPRFEEQILLTVLGIEGVEFATITLNGTPLVEFFGGPMDDTVELYFVALGGNGKGPIFGCGDSLVPVEVTIDPTNDRATLVERALEALFAIDDDTYGETDLYNALSQSDLTVDAVTLAGNVAYVSLSGDVAVAGTCDEPRFERQIRQTVLALSSIDEVNVMLNGTPLDEYFGPPEEETETVEIYFVAIGDNGENGKLIGCQDSLIPVEVEIEATDDLGVRVLSTLNALIETEEQTVTGPNGIELYNALANSEIGAIAADVTGGLATVDMAGDVSVSGTCDEPRFIEQIRQTILQFDGVQITNVFLNGELLRGYFSPENLDEGVLATFDVNGQLFQLWSTNPDTIDQIMALEAGTSNANIPNGPILRGSGTANHNTPWSWHLDPEMTSMAEVTIEVCDGIPSFVEANLDYFVDQVGQYCPWGANLIHVQELGQNGSI